MGLGKISNVLCWARRVPNGVVKKVERCHDPTQHGEAARDRTGLVLFVAVTGALLEAVAFHAV